MAITTKNRKDLKSNFVKNAIPTEQNFADLVEAQLNQADDGVFKLAGEPLSVVAAAGGQKRVLRLYADYPTANPDWLISLNPAQNPADAATNRPGFGITDGAGNTRLFLDSTGKLGLGTNEPQGGIDARLNGSTDAWHRFVVTTTPNWGDAGAQHVTIGAGGAAGIMLSNPYVSWRDGKAAISYGRTSGTAGNTYWDVGVRDDGRFGFFAGDNGGAGEHVWINKAGMLTARGGLVVEGGTAHLDRDGALYRHVDGQVYLTVDDNLYIRKSGAASWASHFDVNTGSLNLKGSLNAGTGLRVSGNGGSFSLEGNDHNYIQFFPQKLVGGRKGWIGYGNVNTTALGVYSEAGPLELAGTAVTITGNTLVRGALAANDGQNTGVGRGLWLWASGDSNHVIYSASPQGKSPANAAPATGFHNASHRMRFRTDLGQGFLFENRSETPLVDIASDTGNLWTRGAVYVGGSDLYFTQTDHAHSGIGNTMGYAAIENATNFEALMILGRQTANGRIVKLWDYLEVNGNMRVTGTTLRIGDWTLESAGAHLYIKRGANTVARFSTAHDRFNVFRDVNGVGPYAYYNAGGTLSTGGSGAPP